MKKWLTAVRADQYDWIKQTSKEMGVKGSVLIREMIDRCMTDNQKEFKASLEETQIKAELQTLADKRATIAEKENQLKQKLKGNRVAV